LLPRIRDQRFNGWRDVLWPDAIEWDWEFNVQ
jgi:hypothetical protein